MKTGKIITYTGLTHDMERRMKEHTQGWTITTERYNKIYVLQEIRYRELYTNEPGVYEQTFKKYNIQKKLKISKDWKRWAG